MLKKLIVGLTMVILTQVMGLGTVFAYSINDVEVIRYGERYLITFEAKVDAPLDDVKDVIYDFEGANKLTPAVKSTEVYRFDETTARVSAVMRPCLFIFCKTMKKLTIVNLEEEQIHLMGIEDAGSFRYSDETIKFAESGTGTMLKYKGDISPKFFMPQWLGVRFVRGSVRKYLGGLLANIEAKAQEIKTREIKTREIKTNGEA